MPHCRVNKFQEAEIIHPPGNALEKRFVLGLRRSTAYIGQMVYGTPHRLTLILAGAVACVSSVAHADSSHKPTPRLPGVDGGYSIVQPLKAEPDQTAPNTGQFRIGDVDVHISGDITIDVGVGSTRPTKR